MANKQFLDKDGADYLVQGLKAKIPTKVSELTNDSGFKTTDNDTKNTAGSTDTSSKIFLIGATSQAANPQTYSHDTAYVGTDGCLYSNSKKVLTDHQSLSGLVPTTRTVNGKALSADISLTASDVGALPSTTVIPTVNNATLTIQKNGTTVKTFTSNASDNVTANITVPTKVSELTNDSGFKTTDNNTTYSLTQDTTDGHKITLTPSTGTAQTVTIPDNNTTYTFAEGTTNGAFSVTPSGGSATSVKVHGVITDISGKQDKITSTNKLSYDLISGTPTIPTITDTYSATSSNGMSGKAVASAISGKQNTLATQTAYSAKGSATKVPQITTNTLGQVTAITEVTITDNDTKNTAGSTDTSSKIYLVGATSQAANPQTYSDNEVFATNGQLTSKSFSLGGNVTIEYNSSDKCIEFNFS